ncbi:MAG: PepSY domain-containing protein, partial [Planctomycetota bacterium]
MSGLRKTRGEGYEISDRLFLLYWHFWIGLLITPVLLLMCITGGILLFEDELLLRVYPTELSDSQWQEGQFEQRLSQDYYDKILPMVQEKLEPDQVVWRVELEHRKG